MSLPTPNAFTNLLSLNSIIDSDTQLEKRMVNSVTGQVEYIGYSLMPSANTSLPIWFIVKISYDVNGFLNYYQLPNNGVMFGYIWDNFADYF